MEINLRQRLIQVSADFYRFHADSFEQTRQNAWNSWQAILPFVPLINKNSPDDQSVCILDLGCGNGRFASFLNDNDITNVNYTGIDTEKQLILKAQERHPEKRFQVGTIEQVLTSPDNVGGFDLIVCFGVFHHLPGVQYRFDILNRFLPLLRPEGTVAISLWQPKLLSNFDIKVCTTHAIEGLEQNDFLLGWKGDFSHLRYCHHFDDAEIDELISASQLKLVRQFQGTGNDVTNRYLIFKLSL